MTELGAVIAEHDNYMNSRGIVNDGHNFTSLDNMSMKHAKDHLEFIDVDDNEISQKQATIDALNE